MIWRMKTPVIFMFVMPAALSLILGPALAASNAAQAQGRSAIGFAVMFSYMTVNYTGVALFREFEGNTWMRQATHRPPPLAFLLGKIVPVVVLGLVQLSIFAAIGLTVLHVPLHGNVFQLAVIMVPLAVSGAALGAAMYAFTRASSTFESVTYLLVIAFGALGGAVVSADRLPAVARLIGVGTPHHWALRGFDEITLGAASWDVVLQSSAVITAFAAVLFALAVARFDYRDEKAALA
jgi:ABC-2 type transport system permease protein